MYYLLYLELLLRSAQFLGLGIEFLTLHAQFAVRVLELGQALCVGVAGEDVVDRHTCRELLGDRLGPRGHGAAGGVAHAEACDGLAHRGGDDVDDAVYEERWINMGGKNTAAMKAGERIIINTPGGGGWGNVGDAKAEKKEKDPKHAWRGGSYASREEMALQA